MRNDFFSCVVGRTFWVPVDRRKVPIGLGPRSGGLGGLGDREDDRGEIPSAPSRLMGNWESTWGRENWGRGNPADGSPLHG